uniref:Uncharacterized protein n=1 Tax=Moniliophthora roreri TaxID=221103 RepID=A0A0W0FXV2_MONRR
MSHGLPYLTDLGAAYHRQSETVETAST